MADPQIEFFTPKIEQTGKELVYRSDNLGGYNFIIAAHWKNVSNQSALGEMNAIVFLFDSDNTQAITLTLSTTPESEKGIPIDIKNKIEKSLVRKKIGYSVISDRIYNIGDKGVEEVDVALDNNRMMYVIGMYYGNLTVVGNLAYKKDNSSAKKELAMIFETFQHV